jgi:tetratricopeptide (TPR) repeat protein
VTLEDALNLALQHHSAARLALAESIYRQILAKHPTQADALHLLGVLRHQAGETLEGIELIERAIAVQRDPRFLGNLGELCRNAGQVERGIAACQEAIQRDPSLAPAYHNLAVLLEQDKRLEEALQAARKGVAVAPNDASGHRIVGKILADLGRHTEGHAELDLALRLNPPDGLAWMQLAAAFNSTGRIEHAIHCYKQALQRMPESSDAIEQLGKLLLLRGRCAEALVQFERLAQLVPSTIDLQLDIARSLEGMNRFDEAIALCRSVLEKDPKSMVAHGVIANALMQSARCKEAEAGLREAMQTLTAPNLHQILTAVLARDGRFEEALQEIDKALELLPDYPIADFSKGLVLLFMGRFEEGWKLFEARWKHPQMDAWRHVTDKPTWDGSPLNGKRILLHAEQGLGDTIQFGRYATLVADRGGRVILEVQPSLSTLLKSIPGVERVVARGEPLGEFDTLAPLLSLPAIVNTTLQTIPGSVPYVHADPAKVEKWRAIIGDPSRSKVRVAIAWMGGDFLRENHLRSTMLSTFAPLAAIPSVRFYSVQKGPSARETLQPPPGMDLANLDPYLHDFSDTAAAIAHMDVVISVDTAVVHLAGAMAKPVWNLLASNIDHRWLIDRDDTPWYPTMRLFRQTKLGDWTDVMQRVAEELRKIVDGRNPAIAVGPPT